MMSFYVAHPLITRCHDGLLNRKIRKRDARVWKADLLPRLCEPMEEPETVEWCMKPLSDGERDDREEDE